MGERYSVSDRFYTEAAAGGFTRFDGTVEFFSRVNALLTADMTVLDFGAGRGAHAEDQVSSYRRELCNMRGKVKKVIGLDVSSAVLENPSLDEALVYSGGRLPLQDASVDLVVSDWTLEHVSDPYVVAAELARVIKPGGWFCARTPHLYSILVLASAMVSNRWHTRILSRVQPGREARDVFPTHYRLNTQSAIRKYFGQALWQNHSYTWSPEPAYHFGNPVVFQLLRVYQYVKRPFLGGECLFAFLRRSTAAVVT